MLKPGGIVGLACFNTPTCIDSVSMNTARASISNLIAEFGLPDKIQLLTDNYKHVVMPYPTRKDHMEYILFCWSLDDYLDSCMTLSSMNNMIKSKRWSVEEGREHLTQLLKEAGMTECDRNSDYTWSLECPLVTASKYCSSDLEVW